MESLKLGDKLYHYLVMRGVGTYEVIGVDGDFLMVKSLACNNQDHACIVKLNRLEGYKTRWKFVGMVQSCGADVYYDSDDEEVDTNYMWHNESPFFERKGDCKKFKWKEIVSKRKEEVANLEKEIARLKLATSKKMGQIVELELLINGVEL